MTFVRLETIHPMLVHLTIGGVVLLAIAYTISAIRRSNEWSFAGDVILLVTTLITLATASLGFVADWVVSWPGGLGLWRWLHLGLGALSTVLLGIITYARWRKRIEHSETKRTGVLLASIGTMIVVFAGGWIGGEVLVYHSGIAVQAAGKGALAPALHINKKAPGGLHDAMHEIRGSWSPIQTTLAEMLVHQPDPEQFKKVRLHAERVEVLGKFIHDKTRPVDYMHSKSKDEDYKGKREKHFEQKSTELATTAQLLKDAADRHDIEATTQSGSRLTELCASCHYSLRW